MDVKDVVGLIHYSTLSDRVLRMFALPTIVILRLTRLCLGIVGEVGPRSDAWWLVWSGLRQEQSKVR